MSKVGKKKVTLAVKSVYSLRVLKVTMNVVKTTYQSDEDEGAASGFASRTDSAGAFAEEALSGSNIVASPSSTI